MFSRKELLVYAMYTVGQSQKAVSAYFTSKQKLPFVFAEQYTGKSSSEPGIKPTIFRWFIKNKGEKNTHSGLPSLVLTSQLREDWKT